MHSANKQREHFQKRVRQSTRYTLHVMSMFSTNKNIINFKHHKQSSNIHRNHLGTELFLFISCTSFNTKLTVIIIYADCIRFVKKSTTSMASSIQSKITARCHSLSKGFQII